MVRAPIETIFSDSEAGLYSEARFSLEELREKIQNPLTFISELRLSLYRASLPFDTENRSILPRQCREAIKTLEEINEPIQELSKLLRDGDHLPIIFTALCYRLLSILNLLEEQVSKLLDLLNSYRSLSISQSHHARLLRKEIDNSFKRLLQHITALSEQVNLLDEEAEEQEARFLSLFEN